MGRAATLALIMVPLGIANAIMNAGREPLWFQIAVLATMAAAVPLGGWLRRESLPQTVQHVSG